MKYSRIVVVMAIMCLTTFFGMTVSAYEDTKLNIWIDSAQYDVRAGAASVKVDLMAYIPYSAAKGTMIYNPDVLTLKEVNYDKQALELSYYEDESSRGIIKICCYGKSETDYPENIRFVFIADTSFNGDEQFVLSDLTICDSDNSIITIDEDLPLELHFTKGSEAKNPLSEYNYNLGEKNTSLKIPTEAENTDVISIVSESNSQEGSNKLFFNKENDGCNRDVVVYSILTIVIIGALIYRFIVEAKRSR